LQATPYSQTTGKKAFAGKALFNMLLHFQRGLKVRLIIEKRFKALLKFDACHTRSLTLISINTSASFCRPLASRDITVPIGT
jgi:hypothetical protein